MVPKLLVAAIIVQFGVLGAIPIVADSSIPGEEATVAGLAMAALGLLTYTLKSLVSGDVISRQSVEGVTSQAVRETLREINKLKGN